MVSWSVLAPKPPGPLAQNQTAQGLPYSDELLRQDLERLRSAWRKFQKVRRRDAVYSFLHAVFQLVDCWNVEGRAQIRARCLLSVGGIQPPKMGEPFSALIVAAAHPYRPDKRTISKWSRALRYAAECKRPLGSLKAFIKRKGGINGCADRYTRRLRRRRQLDKKE